jgi:hypothetical protein
VAIHLHRRPVGGSRRLAKSTDWAPPGSVRRIRSSSSTDTPGPAWMRMVSKSRGSGGTVNGPCR